MVVISYRLKDITGFHPAIIFRPTETKSHDNTGYEATYHTENGEGSNTDSHKNSDGLGYGKDEQHDSTRGCRCSCSAVAEAELAIGLQKLMGRLLKNSQKLQ
ncbi:hypothetical protein Droror1_Dr00006093 [Drosera rotundifolia]